MSTEQKDTRTEAELVQEALSAQNACNLSGVVRSFSRALSRLWDIAHDTGKGTSWVNGHRVARLYADKIKWLSGELKENDFSETDLTNF